jgi:hypothetical protein
MAKSGPTVKGDKKQYFQRRLMREVSNFFKWDGLEDLGIPVDVIERNLLEKGRLIFFKDPTFGYLITTGNITGQNIYSMPTRATPIPNVSSSVDGDGNPVIFSFNELRVISQFDLKDMENAGDSINHDQVCVVLDNMLNGENVIDIVDFYCDRFDMIWKSMDTNLLWQNLPPIIAVKDNNLMMTINSVLNDIWSGKPVVVVDSTLSFTKETMQAGIIDIPIKQKELFDAYQELYNDFRAQVGIRATAVDKQSGVTEQESTSNEEQLKTALEVMLSQRQEFCRIVNKIYGLKLSVQAIGGVSDGESNNRTEKPTEQSKL